MTRLLQRAWRRTIRATGYAGPAALLLLMLVGALAATAPRLNRELQRDYAEIEYRATTLRTRAAETLREPARDDRLLGYIEAFPRLDQMPADLGEIYASAERHNVALIKGEYQLKVDHESPFVSYVATFPVRSEYGSVKAFASDVLQSLPHASLDELRLSREGAEAEALEAVVRFTLTYQGR
jgi:hypothetical protein